MKIQPIPTMISQIILIGVILWAGATIVSAQQPVGVWDFDDSTNLLKATVGNDLELKGNQTAIPGLKSGDGAVIVPKGSYYIANHGIAPNGGGSYVNQYSLIIDIEIPSLGVWYSLFNTSDTNANEGDLFIDPTGKIGLGATGYSDKLITTEYWHRVGIVVDLEAGIIKYFLNGELIHSAAEQPLDGRHSLYSTNDANPWILLFADANGDDAAIYASRVALYDTALTDDEVKALKGPGGNNGPVAATPISGTPPTTPTITVSPENPSGLDDVTLKASAFFSASNTKHANTLWQIAMDAQFTQIYLSSESTTDLTSYSISNSKLPFNTPLFARAKFVDSVQKQSDFSLPVSFSLLPPKGMKLIFSENFNATADNQLPSGWTTISLTDDPGSGDGLDYYRPELKSWSVQPVETLKTYTYFPYYHDAALTPYDTFMPITEGKTCIADCGDFASSSFLYHTFLFTPSIDLSGVTNVVLTFNSNYVQNQDNIASVEYSIDGGKVDESAYPAGTWYPLAYYLNTPDVMKDDQGKTDGQTTLEKIADGTSARYGDYILAGYQTEWTQLGDYIHPVADDSTTEGKRFEKFRLNQADQKSKVKIAWMMMGTWSWYFGIDNLQIWGTSNTSISDWTIF